GADAVFVQIRVGGQQARYRDETLPLRCGCIGQETTGAGGFAKALRTVPIVLDLATEIEARAADGAWIVDFTNPVGIVTRSLLDAGHRAIGLCNVAIGFQRLFARWLDVSPMDVQLGHAGLNHLTWIKNVKVGGVHVLETLIAAHRAELADRVEMPMRLIDVRRGIPSYYLRYFYMHDVEVALAEARRTRAEDVMDIERALLEQYRDPNLRTKPEMLGQRGGAYYSEAAVQLVASLATDRNGVQVVDVRNGDALPFLPADAVVEVPARIGRDGATPADIPSLDPEQMGLIAHVAAYERLAVEAAITGDREVAFRALLAHP